MRTITLWAVVIAIGVLLFVKFNDQQEVQEISIAFLLHQIDQVGDNAAALFNGPIEDHDGRLEGEFATPVPHPELEPVTRFRAEYQTFQGEFILQRMTQAGVDYWAHRNSGLMQQFIFSLFFPLLILVVIWIFIMRQFQSTGNKAMTFGKSKARLLTEGQNKITFDDVAGIEEAKDDLLEIVDFLKDPHKYSRLGGKIPKGVLLFGPPGTGKTLLAKAVAGEANVPFFSISGSDFVEMFVGVGASRVRDLFEQGKKHKPCLIFMDEIDAVGRQRFAGVGGGHDEREQTLNQLLVEMDGFNANEGVILIAATNRPDVLDPALLRPGRFDRRIAVDFPDLSGREKILAVHAKKVKMAADVNLSTVAKGTPGFSGADLANLVNEAALLAARRKRDSVDLECLEEAKDRVIMGPERRSLVISEDEKEVIAYHEAGHAIVGHMLPEADPIHRVTIVPRGMALGLTASLPDEDKRLTNRSRVISMITMLFGGRTAEEMRFGEVWNGASNDIERATKLTQRMVCEWGMSDRLGLRSFGQAQGHVFLGRDLGRERDYSESMAQEIDAEIREILDGCHDHATQILTEHRDALERVAQALMERESLDAEEFRLAVEGKPLPEREPVIPPPQEPEATSETEERRGAAKDGKAKPLRPAEGIT
ncbi:ATP-dependent zinc metalloprotease FtsH [Candidatus Sumerlaeota bacterium]|nr:ATP-dependent zinc metalloprotease FtsH [Candidatus Sumerlaeota bacterium]